jgi:predicted nuclease of predicted toxin-antitoxin system
VSLPLYLDHHVRVAVAKGLRRRGFDILTALEDGHAEASDAEMLARATDLGRIVFTQDDDFLSIADNWQRAGRHFAGVIYAHQLRATVGQIVADLQLILEAATPDEMRNSVLFLPL